MIQDAPQNILIKNLKPILHEGEYVFVEYSENKAIPIDAVIAMFREKEGVTLIMKRSMADELGYTYSFIAAWITLMVYSSLESVGLTARVSNALADAGISCNAIAANYHDHIFIPYCDVQKAMAVLSKL